MLYFSKLRIISVILFTLLLSYFAASNFFKFDDNYFNRNINLGLDLQGGSYLLLEIDNEPVVIQQLQNKLLQIKNYLKEKEINYKNIILKNDKVISFEINENQLDKTKELFDKDDSDINPYYQKYKSHEFDLFINNNIFLLNFSKYGLINIKSSSQNQAIEIVRRRVDEIGTNEPNILKRGNDRILVELPGLDNPDRIKSLLGKTANLTFRLVTDNEDDFGSEILSYEDSDDKLVVSKRVIVSGDNLTNATPALDNIKNQAVVNFNFDRVGAKKFGRATTNNVGKRLAIILDNKIISAPNINEPIVGGSGQISGNFTFQSATDLALLLRSGALPAPLNVIEERTVGPDLGEDSIKAGTISLIIGFAFVIFFMFFKYRFLGLIANVALIVNLIILLGILTILEATLTLPGIAGIILTVGMAVDANVLIFERIKEEMKSEESSIHSFDAGYKKARTAIFDANITTLISAIILFFLGSGPVKGFDITLGIGILTTLFSAYYFARHLSSYYVLKNKDKVISI